MTSNKTYLLPIDRVRIDDSFWRGRIERIVKEVIPYQWDALNDNIPGAEPSHAVENFRIAAGLSDGEFHGMKFQDSDVAKWLEAAANSLRLYPDAGLEALADGLIDIVAAAQQPDGYLNTFFTVAKPGRRWTDLSHGHELYCAGHLIEAAVAYFEATGKRKLLDTMCRYADYIDSVMGPEPHKLKIYCGHEEIELALVKLYRTTGKAEYLRLSEYFIEQRGREPNFLDKEETFGDVAKDRWFALDYHQAHAPVREQQSADGHAVRAMYLYAAMADLAFELNDATLADSLRRLWDSVVKRRMYVTGAIGSDAHGERFSFDYDLPNDVAYAETCASIGLVFWAQRMLRLDPRGGYADVMERALYNGVLSGISLDGTKYFYVNPLEVVPQAARTRYDHKHVEPERVGWFGCACCPPNIARLMTSLGQYIYTMNDDEMYVHLYIGNEAKLTLGGNGIVFKQKTEYPWNGAVKMELAPESASAFAVSLRIPSWAGKAEISVNGERVDAEAKDGFARIHRTWQAGDTIRIVFPMDIQRMRAHPFVRENAGKVCLQRGPMVYCVEEADNGPLLSGLSLPKDSALEASFDERCMGGCVVIKGQAQRTDAAAWSGELYAPEAPAERPTELVAVPYSMWGNRKPGEMAVWIRET